MGRAARSTTYRGVKIYETPAPTQGFTVLEMLNLLEAYDVARWPFLGPDHVHLSCRRSRSPITIATGTSPIPSSRRCRSTG